MKDRSKESHAYYVAHRTERLAYAKRRYQTPSGRLVAERARKAYFQRTCERRRQAIESLGGTCYVCGSKIRLELHHLLYDDEWNGKHQGWNIWRRTVKEVEQHPERFRVLCHFCHKVVTIFGYKKTAWARLKKMIEDEEKKDDKAKAINGELKGKHLLLIAGYAMLLNHYEKHASVENIILLELELEELEGEIKALKRTFKGLTKTKWGRRR